MAADPTVEKLYSVALFWKSPDTHKYQLMCMALNCYPWKLGLGRPWVGVIGHAWGKLFGGKTPDDRNLSLGFGKEEEPGSAQSKWKKLN